MQSMTRAYEHGGLFRLFAVYEKARGRHLLLFTEKQKHVVSTRKILIHETLVCQKMQNNSTLEVEESVVGSTTSIPRTFA